MNLMRGTFAMAAGLVMAATTACTTLISVPTQKPQPPGTPQACPAALITGTLVADVRWGIALDDPAGFVREVVWPSGYAARDDGRLLLLNEAGRVVAREGDQVTIGGGEIGSDGAWLACGGLTVIVQGD